MQGPSRNFLARAGLTGQQYGGRQWCDAGNGRAQLPNGGRLADQSFPEKDVVGCALELVAEDEVLAPEPHTIKAVCYGVDKLVGSEWP